MYQNDDESRLWRLREAVEKLRRTAARIAKKPSAGSLDLSGSEPSPGDALTRHSKELDRLADTPGVLGELIQLQAAREKFELAKTMFHLHAVGQLRDEQLRGLTDLARRCATIYTNPNTDEFTRMGIEQIMAEVTEDTSKIIRQYINSRRGGM